MAVGFMEAVVEGGAVGMFGLGVGVLPALERRGFVLA